MPKTLNPIKSQSTPAKVVTQKRSPFKVCDSYYDVFSLREMPVSIAFIDRLSLDLVKWATDDPDATKLGNFIRAKKLQHNTFYDWSKKYPQLKAAHEFALRAIGDRREQGALINKFNTSVVLNSMVQYDPEWKEVEEWRTNLKVKAAQQQHTASNFTVVVDTYKDDNDNKEK